MSDQAIKYVHQLAVADPLSKRVLLVLAQHTEPTTSMWGHEIPEIMGLDITETDLPTLAAQAGFAAEEFRQQLRQLKQHVKMDVLEHSDGTWEIVYGPSYTDKYSPIPQPVTEENVGGLHDFAMPGWEYYSTWGWEEGLGHFYAQIIHNSDDRDATPRIWITPPRYVVRTIDELAQVIADEIAPYEPIRVPASVIKMYMTKPPLSPR
ncbi:hypothetical protein [Kitasatospora sp. NPDC056731]|uniref:hypothetical protein n=1 Tax=Kitasatospora sp. NPDC056731 TaxID=3155422 RepID=UPI0034254206